MKPEAAAAEFVLGEPASRTRDLIKLLADGEIATSSSRARVTRGVVLGADSLDRTMDLLRSWQEVSNAEERLSRTLCSLLDVKEAAERRCTRAELVWTGHRPPGSPLRGTPPIVHEMLDAATKHVVVLSYSVWLGHMKVESVLDRLVAARRRGANVTFVIDRNYSPGGFSGHNTEQLRAKWPVDAPHPDVYSWGDDDDEIAKLHAKVIVVDRRDLLVTSANLTGHGMSGNLELGVRLTGKPAEQVHDHVMDLIRRQIFRREVLW